MPVAQKPSKDLIDLESARSTPRTARKRTASEASLASPRKSRSASRLATPVKPKRPSAAATPAARRAPTASKTGSPLKKPAAATRHAMPLSEISELPESILQALAACGITSTADMPGPAGADALYSRCEPILFPVAAASDKAVLAHRMQKELLAAWLRFLAATASGAAGSKTTWRDWINVRMLDDVSAKGMLEAESFLRTLRPRTLITQRSALRKVAKQPASKVIRFADLKQAKSCLTKVPSGRAAAKNVSTEILHTAKQGLRKTK